MAASSECHQEANSAASNSSGTEASRECELYSYQAPWIMYGLSWSNSNATKFRLAVGSFVECSGNHVQIIESTDGFNNLSKVGEFDLEFPPTKVCWTPSQNIQSGKELLATTGDYLRLWSISEIEKGNCLTQLEHKFNHSRSKDSCAPLTGIDWNTIDTNMVGACSIDTTISIWDLNSPEQPKTQLIAHDAEVYDMAFNMNVNEFASVGADGSLRLFDLRNLDSSTITYETSDLCPILRLNWNKQDTNYITILPAESDKVLLIDIRMPSRHIAQVQEPQGNLINAVTWSPQTAAHICTVGEGLYAYIWDFSSIPKSNESPILSYFPSIKDTSGDSISQVQWCPMHSDWIAMIIEKELQVVRI